MYDIIYQYDSYKYAIVNHAFKTIIFTDTDNKALNIMVCDYQYIMDLIDKQGYKTNIYYDERDYYINELELYNEYLLLKENSDMNCSTFAEYIKVCTSKNGTLTKMKC